MGQGVEDYPVEDSPADGFPIGEFLIAGRPSGYGGRRPA
jgi:hypothetical protein